MYGQVGENRAVAIESRHRHDDAHNVPDGLGEDLNLDEDAAPLQRGKQAKKDDAETEALPTEPPTGTADGAKTVADEAHPQHGKQAKPDDAKEALPTEPPTVPRLPLPEPSVPSGPPPMPGAPVQVGLLSMLSTSPPGL